MGIKMKRIQKIYYGMQQMVFKKSKTIGIGMVSDAVIVVQADHSRAEPMIDKIFSVPLGTGTTSEKGALIRERAGAERLQKGFVTACLPQRLAIVKYVDLPSANHAEIRQMIAFQALRQMPFSAEEIITDFEVLGADERGHSRVMMIVVRREDVDQYLDILKMAGLSPDKIVLASHAAGAFVRDSEGTQITIEISSTDAVLAVFENGRIQFARSIPMKKGLLAGGIDQWQDKLVSELKMSLEAYQKTNKLKAPIQVFLLGEEEKTQALRPVLQNEFGLKMDIQQTIDCQKRFETSENVKSLACGSAVGAALLGQVVAVNLLPKEEMQRKTQDAFKKEAFVFSSLLLVFLCALSGVFVQNLREKQGRLKFIRESRASAGSEVKELRQMQRQVEAAKEKISGKGTLVEVMKTLNQTIPRGISLSTLTFEKDRFVVVQGMSFTLSKAVNLVKQLNGVGPFVKAELKSSNTRRLEGKDMVDFQIYCQLKELTTEHTEGTEKRLRKI